MKLTIKEFIEGAKLVHGNKYDYSKVEYINNSTKVCIICPIHGEFWQRPNSHLKGESCPLCSHRSFKYTSEEFIERARKVHGEKYDYSKVEYINNVSKVCIICPIHGEFWQRPNVHLRGFKCPKCNGRSLTSEEWIEKAKLVHGDKYDYSETIYLNARTKVNIKCKEHGEFLQRPNDHIYGCGCPFCNESHLEREVNLYLNNIEIEYERQKRFDWLGIQSLDFYLSKYNIAIECQGSQHYVKNKYFKSIDDIKERDERKRLLCKENGINLIYYQNKKYNKYALEIDNVIVNNINELNDYIGSII